MPYALLFLFASLAVIPFSKPLFLFFVCSRAAVPVAACVPLRHSPFESPITARTDTMGNLCTKDDATQVRNEREQRKGMGTVAPLVSVRGGTAD